MITWWQLILDKIVWAVVIMASLIFYKRWSVRSITRQVKGYLSVTLAEHRNKAAELVGQGVEERLTGVKEELRIALADVVRAEAAQDIAETATRAKSDFLSKMSHEIRTPINGIIGSLDLINPDELTPLQAEDVNRAIISSNRLLGIINQILDFAKIEASEIEYQSQPFDLGQVVQDVVDVLAPQATDKGLKLISEFGSDLITGRRGDQQKIHQVLLNLVENAIKFTGNGQVDLKVNGDDERVIFQVIDSGIGIAKEKIDTIFESFTQVGPNQVGTGLGLSICQEFVAGMGGQLRVDSQPNRGSNFSFDLELEKSNGVESESESESESVRNGVKVLVVDDDKVNQQVVCRYLETMGVNSEVAEDGKQAVKRWEKTKFDLILMDLQMPVLNGFEATGQIRKLEKITGFPRTRIVALTASLVDQVEEQCQSAGMDGYIPKPFKRQDLIDQIELVSHG